MARPLSKAAADEARVILAAAREELTRADGKAALLLAASGVAIGALMAALLAGAWSPSDIANGVEWIWWLGAVVATAGVGGLGYAVFPRTTYRGKDRPPELIAYYGDVVKTPKDDLADRLTETAASDGSSLVDQLVSVSNIVDKKYLGIQIGLIGLAGAAILCAASVLLNLAAN